MTNKSPLRYPGGKTRACKKLDEILNRNFNLDDFNCIVSPFFGGGSFEIFVQNKYNMDIIANDKFKPLYSFWISAKNQKSSLCEKIRAQKSNEITSIKFKSMREEIITCDDTLTQGTLYFIINRCSFSGSTLSGGFSKESSLKRFTESSIKRIENLDLSKSIFFNQDFTDFINLHFENDNENDKKLLFLDPPYYLEKGSKPYGNNGDMH